MEQISGHDPERISAELSMRNIVRILRTTPVRILSEKFDTYVGRTPGSLLEKSFTRIFGQISGKIFCETPGETVA